MAEFDEDETGIDSDGNTALHLACRHGHLSVVEKLLDHGALIDSVNEPDNETPLHLTCRYGHVDIAKVLLDHGADINSKTKSGISPLHLACSNGNFELISLLLESENVVIDSHSAIGTTPLLIACKFGRIDIVTALLDKGASLKGVENSIFSDEAGYLRQSCAAGHFDIASLFLSRGINIDSPNKYGFTPLFSACSSSNLKAISFLLDHGANPQHLNKYGESPIVFACTEGLADVTSLLLDYGVGIDTHSPGGSSLLHLACRHLNLNVIKVLLERNASIHDINQVGDTCVHAACSKGTKHSKRLEPSYWSQIIRTLFEAGADLTNGETPLDLAKKSKLLSYKYLEQAMHFQQYRQSWLMFSQALNSLPSENFKISRDQNKPSSLLKLLEISDLHRYITEFL